MRKTMFKRIPGKRIAAVVLSLAMLISVFAAMGIISSAATTPIVLTADKWVSDGRLSFGTPSKGVVKISNATTYTDPIWPAAEATVSVNLDALPYLCVQTNDLNTPYSLYARVEGGGNVYLLNSQYGGSVATGPQSYNLAEALGASGTQTVTIGVHWLTGSADYAATEIGQRYITFSDFVISDKADDFTVEPVALTADKWVSDGRLSFGAPSKGVVKISNATTYTDPIWPAAEATVSVNLDALPYLCVQTNDLNTPYSLYARVEGGGNVYLLNSQYGGSVATGPQSYDLADALGASGTQTVTIGVHWLTGSADYAATEIGQRYITFSDFVISDKADDFTVEPVALTADKWVSDGRLSFGAPSKGVVKISNATTYTDPIWPAAEATVSVNLDALPYLCVQTNDLNTPYSLYARVEGGGNVYLLNSQYGGSVATGPQSYNLAEALGASGTQTVTIGVHWLTGSADYAATEIGQRYITFSDFVISDKADDFTVEPVALTADKWVSDGRLSFGTPSKGLVKISNATTYTDPIWPAAEATVSVNLDALPYLCIQTNDLNTPYSLYARVEGGGNVYLLNSQYGGSVATGPQSYNLAEALGASGTQTVTIGVHWLTGSADYAATEIGQRYITFSDFVISDKADDFAPIVLDYGAINAQIADAASKNSALYTATTWAAVQTAWDAAIDAKANATTQQELDDAALVLENAIANLEEEIILVYVGINAQIDAAAAEDESKYTTDTWAAMKAAWDAAVAVKASATTQQELDDAALALENAIAALEEIVPVEEPTDLTVDQWGSDTRLAVSALDGGVIYSLNDLVIGANGIALESNGFANYHYALMENAEFVPALLDSIKNLVVEVPLLLLFSLLIAVMLNAKMRGRAIFRAIFFMPVILSTGFIQKADEKTALISALESMSGIDSGSSFGNGIVNALDIQMFLANLNFGTEAIGFILSLVNNIFNIVTMSGVQILIFLAGLQAISPSIYESAKIEGAGAWECFWKITLPMIGPMMIANALYSVIDSFTRTGNGLMELITTVAFDQSRYGIAAAMSWSYAAVIVVFLGIIGLVGLRVLRSGQGGKGR